MKRILFLFIIIIIASLILLTGHVHLHAHGSDDESHCPLCALLNTGLSFSPPFNLFLGFTVLATIFFKTENKINAPKIYIKKFRAPPIPSFGQCF